MDVARGLTPLLELPLIFNYRLYGYQNKGGQHGMLYETPLHYKLLQAMQVLGALDR